MNSYVSYIFRFNDAIVNHIVPRLKYHHHLGDRHGIHYNAGSCSDNCCATCGVLFSAEFPFGLEDPCENMRMQMETEYHFTFLNLFILNFQTAVRPYNSFTVLLVFIELV